MLGKLSTVRLACFAHGHSTDIQHYTTYLNFFKPVRDSSGLTNGEPTDCRTGQAYPQYMRGYDRSRREP